MSVYRMHDGGVWSSRSYRDRIRSRIQVHEGITGLLEKTHPAEAEVSRRSTADDCLKLAELCYKDGDDETAATYIGKALKLSAARTLGRVFK